MRRRDSGLEQEGSKAECPALARDDWIISLVTSISANVLFLFGWDGRYNSLVSVVVGLLCLEIVSALAQLALVARVAMTTLRGEMTTIPAERCMNWRRASKELISKI